MLARRKTYLPLYGYEFTENKNLIPIEDDLVLLEMVKEYLDDGTLTLRDAAAFISDRASRPISYEGLRKRLKTPVRLDNTDVSEG